MIKIKSDFDRTDFKNVDPNNPTILYNYYYSMLEKFKNKYNEYLLYQNVKILKDDFEFIFLPRVLNPKNDKPYTISFKTLLTGTRDEVMAVDGMKFYMDICRLRSCVKSKCKESEFLEQLYFSFPEDITMTYTDNGKKCYAIQNKGNVIVANGNNPTVRPFKIISDYVGEKIKSYDKGYFSYYSSIVRINLINKEKEKKRKYTIPSEITFEELKDFLMIMHDDVTSYLNAKIKAGKEGGKVVHFLNYDDMADDIRHMLMYSLNIKTCPYCNRLYITSLKKDNKDKTTADLDHYYPKSLFPLFSMSVFNFIPSCHVCNSLMKGDKYYEILYPYEDSAEKDVSFNIKLQNGQKRKNIVDIWLGKGKNTFPEIKQISELSLINLVKGKDDAEKTKDDKYREKLIDNEIELFRLNEIYKNHLDQAVNVLLIMRFYLGGYFYTRNINTICKNIGITSVKNGLSITKEEIRDILLGFVNDGQGEIDKPLAKLISDIYNNEADNISSNSVEEKQLNIKDAFDFLKGINVSEDELARFVADKFNVPIDYVKEVVLNRKMQC